MYVCIFISLFGEKIYFALLMHIANCILYIVKPINIILMYCTKSLPVDKAHNQTVIFVLL